MQNYYYQTWEEVNNLKKALNIVLDEKDCINNLVSNLTMEEIERLNLLEQQAIICEIENALWRLVKIKVHIRDWEDVCIECQQEG